MPTPVTHVVRCAVYHIECRSLDAMVKSDEYVCLADGCSEPVENGQPLCLDHRREVQARLPKLLRSVR
jgi:hypothetical protein